MGPGAGGRKRFVVTSPTFSDKSRDVGAKARRMENRTGNSKFYSYVF